METKWSAYLESEICKIKMKNKFITVEEIKQKIHSNFGMELANERIKEEILKREDLLEIKENSFVCRVHFGQVLEGIVEDSNPGKRLQRHYFIRLSEEEIKKVLGKRPQQELITFEGLLKKGLKKGVLKTREVQQLNFDVETEVSDYYEALEELEDRGIKIED